MINYPYEEHPVSSLVDILLAVPVVLEVSEGNRFRHLFQEEARIHSTRSTKILNVCLEEIAKLEDCRKLIYSQLTQLLQLISKDLLL